MSILNQLISGKKPTVATTLGVKKDEPKTETSSTESGAIEAGRVDSTKSNTDDRTTASSATNPVAPIAEPKKPNLLTATLTAVREKSEQDKADHEYLFAPIPKDFQETLDRFDAMMQRDNEILAIDLTRCRDFVKHIMISLKENPEYDGLIIDRDVHNIIKFQRNLKAAAEAIVVTKIDKAAKKSTKPKAAGRFAMDMSDFDLNAPAKPKSIQDLSGFEL